MKTILVGYPGSRKVRNISAYLFEKYTKGLEPIWLEYDADIEGWAMFVADYLKVLDDKEVIFALDDYLISGLMGELPKLGKAVLAKLCVATDEENESYPVTTQYTLWNREYLISLLEQVNTPWEFELKGSEIFKQSDKEGIGKEVIPYYTNSSLSKRWEGIRLDGLSEEDIKEVQQLI